MSCEHLISEANEDYYRVWRSKGDHHHMVCEPCFEHHYGVDGASEEPVEIDVSQLYEICEVCWGYLVQEHRFYGSKGKLTVLDAKPPCSFEVEDLGNWRLPFSLPEKLALAPCQDGKGCYMLDAEHNLWFVSEDLTFLVFEHASSNVEFAKDWAMIAGPSPCGKYIAVCERRGSRGYVVGLDGGEVMMELDRGDYHPEQTDFPVVFFTHREETRVAHGTEWNRIDVSDPATGACLTEREPELGEDERPIDEHYIDFFHGPLHVSPDQKWIVTDGWVWQPVAVVSTWNLERWLEENVWEAETGESRQDLGGLVGEDWGWPLCFLDNDTVASWGIRSNLEQLEMPGITLVSTKTWQEAGFIGADLHGCHSLHPWEGNLVAASTNGVSVFSPQTGERLLHLPDVRSDAFCPEHGIFFRVVQDTLTLRRTNILYPGDADKERSTEGAPENENQ
mgnify:FL=1